MAENLQVAGGQPAADDRLPVPPHPRRALGARRRPGRRPGQPARPPPRRARRRPRRRRPRRPGPPPARPGRRRHGRPPRRPRHAPRARRLRPGHRPRRRPGDRRGPAGRRCGSTPRSSPPTSAGATPRRRLRRRPGPPAPTVLDARGLTAGYAGVAVVHGVDLTVGAGEVVALLGLNGAGKTTAMLALAGVLPRMAGAVAVLGDQRARPHRLARLGMACVRQGQAPFAGLTVAEHLRLVGRPGRPRPPAGAPTAAATGKPPSSPAASSACWPWPWPWPPGPSSSWSTS